MILIAIVQEPRARDIEQCQDLFVHHQHALAWSVLPLWCSSGGDEAANGTISPKEGWQSPSAFISEKVFFYQRKAFISAVRGFRREEGKGDEFGQSRCSGQYYFVLYFYNHQFSLQQRVISYLPLMQHSNPVTRNDRLVALTSEADHLHCAGPPEMLGEKQWC